MGPAYWQALTTNDFRSIDPERTVAVLPVAAVEQHGPHLPLGTDALINRGIVDALLSRLDAACPVLMLPPLDVGTSEEHADFPGTLSVAPQRLLPAWVDIGDSVARAGVRKIVILNTHGGQTALVDLAALRFRIDHDMLAVRCNYFAFGAPAGMFDEAEWKHGLHGGEVETSLMLHLRPDLVRREELRDFESLSARLARSEQWLGVSRPVGIGWKAQDLNAAGVTGNAARADASRGAAYLDYIVDSLTALLGEVVAMPLGIIADAKR